MERSEKQELIRIVCNKNGEVALDAASKLPGRGAYICKAAQCLAKARKKRSLERALKHEIPAEVYDNLETELNKT